MAAKILIVTSAPLCRQPRPLKEASTLARAGHDVRVLSVRGRDQDETRDAALLRSLPFSKQSVSASAFTPRVRSWLTRKLTPFGLSSRHALGPFSTLLNAVASTPADLTIVHTELGLCVGQRLLGRRRIVADIEDWHSEDLLPSARRYRPINRLREAERTLLRHALYTSTTSESLANALHARYGGNRPEVITNSFPLQPASDLPTARYPRLPANSTPSFFWFSQTLGPGRGLEGFLAAWQRMHTPTELVLLGEPAGDYPRALLAPLTDDQRSRVRLRALVDPTQLPRVIAEHDIGLALEQPDTPNRDLTISNKILQYLNAGLAVIASSTAGQREVLTRAPAGIILPFEDSASAAAQIDGLLRDRARLAGCRAASRSLAESHYCWEKEEPRLLARVERALA